MKAQTKTKNKVVEEPKVEEKKSPLFKIRDLINKNESILSFALWLVILSALWAGFVLISNNFCILFGWDTASQYVTFYYGYWDIWHHFFKTGEFVLVDFSTYLGVDNIGSNSYYGLFDPFVFVLSFFPRSWIPQTYTFMTLAKVVISALIMRLYLKYMGIKENTARFGAIAYAFSGYMNFMVGFCNFVSICTYVPMILLGIEKVIKEKKVSTLVWSIFLIGITSFFFLVVLCIWGVIYALWRFFQSVGERTVKENFSVLGIGVGCFVVGIFLSAFSLLPSIRQSSLSGRTNSIGGNYLLALLSSIEDGTFVDLMFEMVGGSPAREIMPLVSFFYPTGGYLYLPMMVPSSSYKYDAWVASIFCYTPFIILFFLALLNSGRRKKFSHYIAVILCCYLLFTDFAYFAFYGFTGNGYGRWFLVLIPEIIYYGCWAFDDLEDAPKAFPLISGVLAVISTVAVFALTQIVLDGQKFSNPNGYTYFIHEEYLTAGHFEATYQKYKFSTIFVLLIEIFYVVIESSTFIAFRKKKWFKSFAFYALSVEVVVMGNFNYVFCGYWSLKNSFNGGSANFSESINVGNFIKNDSDLVNRTYFDSSNGEKNFANAVGTNGSSAFHSLMNFEVYDYAIMMKMANTGTSGTSYGKSYYNPSWSANYTLKRFATDVKQGYKYYVIKNGGYPNFESQNVPFNSEKIYDKNGYRVYRNNEAVELGYALSSDSLYYIKRANLVHNKNAFFDGSVETMMRAENLMLDGGIFEDDQIIDGFEIKEPDISTFEIPGKKIEKNKNGYSVRLYTTKSNDLFLAQKDTSWRSKGPGYFIDENYGASYVEKSGDFSYNRDLDKVVVYPSTGFGTYFNEEDEGCYFNIKMNIDTGKETRIYMIGDIKQSDGSYLENQELNFEYSSIKTNNSGGNQVFGMYAPGKVKYICFCAPSGNGKPTFHNPTIYMQNYSEIRSKLDYIHENELKNVKREGTNSLSATSNYSERKIVVTHLAYDDSWKVKINHKSVETFKVDAGFLGFVCPEGETFIELDYKTDYLNLGIILSVVGATTYFSYVAYDFLKKQKQSKLIETVN